MNRRAFLHHLGLGSGLALLAACAPASPSAAPTSAPAASGQAAPATNAPKSGGTLKLGSTTELPNLESHQMSPPTFNIIYQVHDRLVDYDENLQPVPSLAESWEFSPDHKQLTMKLRQGVKFHTGRELTSADIPQNIHHAADPKTGIGNLSVMSSWITDVQTPDKYTVVLVTEQPRPSLFDYLQFLNISDPETYAGPDAKTKVVGTGPFQFVEWVQGDHVTLHKNASYWRSGVPLIDEQQIVIFKDPQSMVAQLEAGAIDGAIGPPLRDAARLKDDPKYHYVANTAAGHVHRAGGEHHPAAAGPQRSAPGDQLRHRSQAHRRHRLPGHWRHAESTALDAAESGATTPPKVNAYAYDIDKARSMLQQAGVSGAQFDMILPPAAPNWPASLRSCRRTWRS